MPTIHDTLRAEAFDGPFAVEGRAAIADLFPKSRRCGIYVLHFADGTAYVGKSVDVSRRYIEHRRNHLDITQVSFRRVAQKHLTAEEDRIRNQLQSQNWQLRGVVGVYQAPGDADIDLVVPLKEQQLWLSDPNHSNYTGSRMVDTRLRATYTGRFAQLQKKPHYQEFISVLQRYVRIGIPMVRSTEASFWSCSCLPKTSVYSRININWQEVLSAYVNEGELIFSFHVALSGFDLNDFKTALNYFERPEVLSFKISHNSAGLDLSFDYLTNEESLEVVEGGDFWPPNDILDLLQHYCEEYPGFRIGNHHYQPGGSDQVQIVIPGAANALRLLEEPEIQNSIRIMNMRLMRHGPCNYSSSHCLDLADLLVHESSALPG